MRTGSRFEHARYRIVLIGIVGKIRSRLGLPDRLGPEFLSVPTRNLLTPDCTRRNRSSIEHLDNALFIKAIEPRVGILTRMPRRPRDLCRIGLVQSNNSTRQNRQVLLAYCWYCRFLIRAEARHEAQVSANHGSETLAGNRPPASCRKRMRKADGCAKQTPARNGGICGKRTPINPCGKRCGVRQRAAVPAELLPTRAPQLVSG